MLDDTPSQEVVDFVFAQCATNQNDMQSDEGDEIDENTIKTYLNFVSGIPTQFDGEALSMLKFYFVVTRSIRPSESIYKSLAFCFLSIVFLLKSVFLYYHIFCLLFATFFFCVAIISRNIRYGFV